MAPGDKPPEPLTAAEALRARFLDEIGRLDAPQWLVVGQRFEAAAKDLAANRRRIAGLVNEGVLALMGRKGFQKHRIAFNRWAHDRLTALVEGLPEEMSRGGRPVPLRSVAHAAARTAEAALGLFEETISSKNAARLAVPALHPFADFVTLPDLPLQRTPTAGATPKPRSLSLASKTSTPSGAFHLRFPDDYFQYDEPAPAGVKIVPPSWYRRDTHHETWNLPVRPDLACTFGGDHAATCAVCGERLHHVITLPALDDPAFQALGVLRIATCLSCLGWSEPVLWFQHDGEGEARPTGYSGSRRSPDCVAHALRVATVHLAETPRRFMRQPWADADGQNLNRLGGRPSWIQQPDVPRCCDCGKRMTFLLQLDSGLPTIDGARWLWGSGGLLYVFWCGRCRIDAQTWQCT